MEKVICCPHEYYSSQFSKFIDTEARSSKHSWIYDIIADGATSKHEQVFIERQQWCLVLDKHHGQDTRYLVVFRDTSLRTIRDLREQHMSLLQNIYETVSKWLRHKSDKKYYFYFNYMPSVFQLHLHVNSNTQHINRERAHFLSVVCANLNKESHYYAKALMLTKLCPTIRRANVHTKLALKLPDNKFASHVSSYVRNNKVLYKHSQNSW